MTSVCWRDEISDEWSDIFCNEGASTVTDQAMTQILIGYARCSTDKQDLAAQKGILASFGVAADRIYTDHGFTGTNRARPGLGQALAALREGDTLVVPKLDRLARSVPDARDIADKLAARGIKLQLGTSIHDPTEVVRDFRPVCRLAKLGHGFHVRQRLSGSGWRYHRPQRASAIHAMSADVFRCNS